MKRKLGAADRPAAGLGAQRRQVLHARDDGHHPEPGPERPLGGRAGREDRQPAVRPRLLPALHPDVRQRRARHRQGPLRARARGGEEGEARESRRRPRRRRRMHEVVERFKAVVRKETGKDFPQDPREQLTGARDAVFKSWMNPRAATYRKLNDIPHDLGTAVNVQSMVFGNMGDSSATGVGFTRNPSTGAQGVLRRVPPERAGRGRGGGHPHPAPDRRAREGAAQGVRAAPRDHHPAGEALQGRAGLRVHHRGEHAVHAPDPQREADGAGRGAHRGGHGGGGHPHQAGGGGEGRAEIAGPAPAPDLRPARAAARRRWRPRGCPRRRAPPPARIVFTADDAVAASRRRASASCSCAWRRCPTTSTA